MVDRMMYSGQVPWHGLGEYKDEIEFEDARRVLCEVVERPVRFDTPFEEAALVAGYKAIVRTDTNTPLCIQKASYGVVQYADQLDVLCAAAGEGELRHKTVGLLDHGRRAFALADIPSAQFDVAGSPIKPYLLLSTSHDSSRLIRYLFTGVYVVCNNTETAALQRAGAHNNKGSFIPNVIQLRHSKRVADRLTMAKQLIAQARVYFGAFNEAALILVNKRFTELGMVNLAKELFPITAEQAEARRKHGIFSISHKAQDKVVALFAGQQRAAAHAPGTAWSAFNAVTEYVDHHANRRGQSARALAESRFDYTLFEGGANIRQEALSFLLAA